MQLIGFKNRIDSLVLIIYTMTQKPIFLLFFLFYVTNLVGQVNSTVYKQLEAGFEAHNQANYTAAISYYTEAIRLRPTFADAYYNRGISFFKQKEYKKAIIDFNETLYWSPADAMAYFWRAETYYALKNYEQAEKNYVLAEQYKIPTPELFLGKRTEIYDKQKNYIAAEAGYLKLLSVKGSDKAAIYYRLAQIKRETAESDKALSYINQCLSLRLKDAPTLLLRANIYLDLLDYKKAKEDLSDAISLKPSDGELYYFRGLASIQMNEKENACKDWKKGASLKNMACSAYLRQYCR
jgi:tetratricopeptide (TPR) repeat protein